jgi:hypothetical protein
MTGDAARETFTNHMEMMMTMESDTPWESYKLAEDYETKDVKKYGKDQRGTKRAKMISPDNASHGRSYAGATMRGKNMSNNRGDSDQTNFSKSDTKDATIQNQVKLLQESQKKHEEKIAEMQTLLNGKTEQLKLSIQRLSEK